MPFHQGFFGEFTSAIDSPFGGLLSSFLTAQQQQELNEEARRLQLQDRDRALGLLGDTNRLDISRLPGDAGQLAFGLGQQSRANRKIDATRLVDTFGESGALSRGFGELGGSFSNFNTGNLNRFAGQTGDIQSQFGQGAAGINQGFGNRLSGAFGLLEGAGRQESADISRRARESLGNQQQDLRARGFGGTLSANIAQGNVRDENDAQGRLQERLRQQRVGLFSDLTGQGLAARERLLGAGTNLAAGFAGQTLGSSQAANQFRSNLDLSALGQQVGLGQFLQQGLSQGRQKNLSNQFQFGQFPIQTGLQAAGLGAQLLGPLQVNPAQQLQFPQILS